MTENALIEQSAFPSPEQSKAAMDGLQAIMQAVLDDQDYTTIRGKKWRKRSAFTKLRRVFNVTVTVLTEGWEEFEASEFGYRVTVRAAFPTGRYEDGDGYCDSTEMRGSGIAATRHNVRAKAFTRAKNRATADLLGTGDVSADELVENETPAPRRQRPTRPRPTSPPPAPSDGPAASPVPAILARVQGYVAENNGKYAGQESGESQRQTIYKKLGRDLGLDDAARHRLQLAVFGKESLTDFSFAEAYAMLRWMSDQHFADEVLAVLAEEETP